MTHKFDITQKSKLDNPKRRELLPVKQVLEEIELKADEIFADIGCGIGYFSIPAAELIHSYGKVYALDVEQEMLNELECRRKEHNIENIQVILTEEYDLKLEDQLVSLAFVCTVLHEVEDKARFLKEVKRILREDGSIAIVEWIKRTSDWGPPISHRIAVDEVKELLQSAGFTNLSETEINEHFYIVRGNL